MPALTIFNDQRIVGRFEWDCDSVLIGRDCQADINLSGLEDLSISRAHARIERVGEKYEIRDVGAKNPVCVNGSITACCELNEADEINIGRVGLVFSAESKSSGAIGVARPPSADRLLADEGSADLKTVFIPSGSQKQEERFLQISHQRLLLLYDITKQFYHSKSPQSLLQKVLAALCSMTHAERAFSAIFDGELTNVSLAFGHNMVVGDDPQRWPVSRTVIGQLLSERRACIMNNAIGDPALSEIASVGRLQIRSVICCPLFCGGETVGLIYADNLAQSGVFDNDDLDLIHALSFHVEAALAMTQSSQDVMLQNTQLLRENLRLSSGKGTGEMVGSSQAMRDVLGRISDIAEIRRDAEVCVLVTGETGTGKELVCREIHAASARSEGPLITVNCAAIPENLVEAELFGVQEGVATGVSARTGLFEAANGGVIFLDEIADMDMQTQAKVLWAIQNRSFIRLGSNEETSVDVWVIAATNKDLLAETAAGRFRQDMYYRLKVLEVHLPPLRERTGDVAELALFFFDKYCREFGKQVRDIDDGAMSRIVAYAWPGNIRELENTMAGCVAFCHGRTLSVSDLPPQVTSDHSRGGESLVSLEEMERQYLLQVLERTEWNKTKTAEILQVGRQAVYQKIQKYQLEQHRPVV